MFNKVKDLWEKLCDKVWEWRYKDKELYYQYTLENGEVINLCVLNGEIHITQLDYRLLLEHLPQLVEHFNNEGVKFIVLD